MDAHLIFCILDVIPECLFMRRHRCCIHRHAWKKKNSTLLYPRGSAGWPHPLRGAENRRVYFCRRRDDSLPNRHSQLAMQKQYNSSTRWNQNKGTFSARGEQADRCLLFDIFIANGVRELGRSRTRSSSMINHVRAHHKTDAWFWSESF